MSNPDRNDENASARSAHAWSSAGVTTTSPVSAIPPMTSLLGCCIG